MHNIKFTILTIFKFGSIKYINIVVQLICRTFSSCRSKTLYPLTPQFPLPHDPGNHPSTFCFMNLTTIGTSCEWSHALFVFL